MFPNGRRLFLKAHCRRLLLHVGLYSKLQVLPSELHISVQPVSLGREVCSSTILTTFSQHGLNCALLVCLMPETCLNLLHSVFYELPAGFFGLYDAVYSIM